MFTSKDRLKLLIVDDDEETLGLLARILPSWWVVDTFTSPRLALAHYTGESHYDFVITDLKMNRKTGESLIFDIKYINPRQNVAVITGDSTSLNLPASFGVQVFHKPLGYKNLAKELVELYLKKKENLQTPFSDVL